jgi:hypothetical protein
MIHNAKKEEEDRILIEIGLKILMNIQIFNPVATKERTESKTNQKT